MSASPPASPRGSMITHNGGISETAVAAEVRSCGLEDRVGRGGVIVGEDQQLWTLEYTSAYPPAHDTTTDESAAISELDTIIAWSRGRNEVVNVTICNGDTDRLFVTILTWVNCLSRRSVSLEDCYIKSRNERWHSLHADSS